MIKRTVSEHGRIPRSDIPAPILHQWQRFDERHQRQTGETVFDWTHIHDVRAKSVVGVMQVGDFQVEILPKIDDPSDRSDDEVVQHSTRQNFLFMLSMAGKCPLHERDLAAQKLQRLPLLEMLIQAFATRLLLELRRGQQHAYVYQESSLSCVRGRILLKQQITHHATQRHKIHVGYDEFICDTALNRILKAGCMRLLVLTRLAQSQQLLREALLDLGDVADQVIAPHDFEEVQYDRNSERFRELIEFCRLVFMGATPASVLGRTKTFSLLFPMEVLFEEFVGGCLKRFADALGFRRSGVHLQAQANRRWLLRDLNGQGKFRLKPDIVISNPSGSPQIIVDTKWKRLSSDEVDKKNSVQPGDMYQLYAYATRYQCRDNILLFPRVAGVTPKRYFIEGNPQTHLRIEFLDLNFNLRRERDRLKAEFKRILSCENSGMPVNA